MIQLTGIADEAGASLDVQIQAHQELGWKSIESRVVEFDGVKGNLHEIPDAVFDKVCARLAEKNMKVCGFGSLIGNWAKKITDDFSITEAEIGRAIPRMQKLGAKLIRVMSYAVCKDDSGKDLEEQFAPEPEQLFLRGDLFRGDERRSHTSPGPRAAKLFGLTLSQLSR